MYFNNKMREKVWQLRFLRIEMIYRSSLYKMFTFILLRVILSAAQDVTLKLNASHERLREAFGRIGNGVPERMAAPLMSIQ